MVACYDNNVLESLLDLPKPCIYFAKLTFTSIICEIACMQQDVCPLQGEILLNLVMLVVRVAQVQQTQTTNRCPAPGGSHPLTAFCIELVLKCFCNRIVIVRMLVTTTFMAKITLPLKLAMPLETVFMG